MVYYSNFFQLTSRIRNMMRGKILLGSILLISTLTLLAGLFMHFQASPKLTPLTPELSKHAAMRDSKGVFYPGALEEVKTLIVAAKEDRVKICLVGTGMSQNSQNNGGNGFLLMNLKKMNHVEIDAKQKTATIQGNVTFSEMEQEANKHKLATKVRQASGIFGIVSSICTNVHGWDLKAGCIEHTVRTLYVLDSDCNEIIAQQGDLIFKNTVGSFGGTYLIYGAVIELTDNIPLEGVFIERDTVEEALEELPGFDDDVDMGLITVGRTKCYLRKFSAVSRTPTVSKDLKPEGTLGTYAERLLIDVVRTCALLRLKKPVEWVYEQILLKTLSTPQKMLRNEFMNVSVNAINKPLKGVLYHHKVCLVEYFVKKEDVPDLVELFRKEYSNTIVLNAALRFVKAQKNSCSIYAKTDMYALVICWDQRQDPAGLKRSQQRNERILEFLADRSGTFYMAYKNKPEDIASFYPEFVRNLNIHNTIFSNQMIEAIRNVSPPA
ncbi:hypothetical protein NEDG_00514 [Nematocida displodere]|uniref:FAD-binding PCMH-type domain-containing protein n=1 Tax=Nematocida displodere TaxID=1805483 RepID=A0A177EM29_9MICR|nr:hypothetical protein NEDG_00514 [Nematocida displodere]